MNLVIGSRAECKKISIVKDEDNLSIEVVSLNEYLESIEKPVISKLD